jgi:hypothetical protein
MLVTSETQFWSSSLRPTETSQVTVTLPRPARLTSLSITIADKCQPDTLTVSVCPEASSEFVELGVVASSLLIRPLRVPLSGTGPLEAPLVSALRLDFKCVARWARVAVAVH